VLDFLEVIKDVRGQIAGKLFDIRLVFICIAVQDANMSPARACVHIVSTIHKHEAKSSLGVGGVLHANEFSPESGFLERRIIPLLYFYPNWVV
jgi:hypothetical protein